MEEIDLRFQIQLNRDLIVHNLYVRNHNKQNN